MSTAHSSATKHDKARSQATRVTVIGMILDVFLGLAKIAGGVITQSFALVTDGIHSMTDAVTDIFVLAVARAANTAPDLNHPYGHGRFETLGTIAMGILFFTTAGILLYDSYMRLREFETLPVPGSAGLLIALISIASKEWIYQYTMRVARRLDSSLLKANAWHSRSDAISSIAVLIGLLGAQQGYPWMDTVAGIFVALIIAKIGWELCADSLKELVDTAVPEQRQKQIEQSILSVDGVRDITAIRTRSSGGKILLEICLLVDSRISVSEGHAIGEIVSRTLTGNFSDVEDVTVHIDPLEHGAGQPSQDSPLASLPPREEVIRILKDAWGELLSDEDVEKLILHYMKNGIEVELVLNATSAASSMTAELNQAIEQFDYIVKLEILNKLFESEPSGSLS